MEDQAVFVGLDYHQSAIQVCVEDLRGSVLGNRSCSNDWRKVRDYAEGFGVVRRAGIEACSGASDFAEELIFKAGWSVDLAHPGYVRRMKQNPDKTDFSDARMLADLERVGYLPRVWLAPVDVRELRLLARHRQALARQRRTIKQRIRAVMREQRVRCNMARPWTRPWLDAVACNQELSPAGLWVIDRHFMALRTIAEETRLVEEELTAKTKEDPLVNHLLKMSGIGQVTAWMIRAEIGRFDRFRTGKQLARFCGLTPFNASSGQRQADAGLIKAANGQLRAILIEAAHRLMRYDPRWRNFAAKMVGRGKPISLVAAAVANRWVRWLYHQMPPEPHPV